MLLLSRRCRKLTRLPEIRNPCARSERRIAERSFFTFNAGGNTRFFYQACPREATTQNSVALTGLEMVWTVDPGLKDFRHLTLNPRPRLRGKNSFTLLVLFRADSNPNSSAV